MISIRIYTAGKRISRYFLMMMILAAGCWGKDSDHKDDASYVSAIQEWHRKRIESLKAENGILSVTGLFWLKEGENSFGSDASNDIVLPEDKAPGFIGSFILSNGVVRIKVKTGIDVMHKGEIISGMILKSDIERDMTLLSLGDFNWFIIERNGDLGVRFRDNKNPHIQQFKGIETFGIDPSWKFEARFEPYEPVRTLSSVTVSGADRKFTSPGALIFRIKNQVYRLDPIELEDTESYLLIFGDETNGEETYGGGRFLYVEKSGENHTTILDFNMSINPPCAISEFYTCPLPSPQNKLPFKVTAGEKKYEGPSH